MGFKVRTRGKGSLVFRAKSQFFLQFGGKLGFFGRAAPDLNAKCREPPFFVRV